MLNVKTLRFCPKCGSGLTVGERLPIACPQQDCGFVYYNNPIPVVAAIVEREDGVILAHNKTWPDGMYGPITGFVESLEAPQNAVIREVEEELGLKAESTSLVGVYGFEAMNQVIIAYHVNVKGDVLLSDELDEYKIIPVSKLKPWAFGTGLAVRDWLESRTKASSQG